MYHLNRSVWAAALILLVALGIIFAPEIIGKSKKQASPKPTKASKAMALVWNENFNNGCASNCLATTWNGWTVQENVGGTNGSDPNNWFVSCAEEGIAPPGCGSSCIGDASLHIGSTPGAGGDMGATFNETGAVNATFRRIVSPTISLVGHSNNVLEFDFIAYGSSSCSDDRAQLHLSVDNGATWPSGFQYCLNSACCGSCNGYSQGQWTTYTLVLPAAFDNNPNVRVAFHWRNNGNGSGTDPSVAIDDIRINSTILPISDINLSAKRNPTEQKEIKLAWEVAENLHLSKFEVEQADKSLEFQSVHSQIAEQNERKFAHTLLEEKRTFLRIKGQTSTGESYYSNVVEIYDAGDSEFSIQVYPNPNKGVFQISPSNVNYESIAKISNGEGKELWKGLLESSTPTEVSLPNLSKGIYFLQVTQKGKSHVSSFVVE